MRIDGHILTPLPEGGTAFFRDSSIEAAADGRITGIGEGSRAEHLIVPGLVDAHVHLPQFRVRGRFTDALLPWLREHIWPEEARFIDDEYAAQVAREFRAGLVEVGTTSALVYGAPQRESAALLLEALQPLCVQGGDVLMDRNGPDALLRSTDETLDSSEASLERWGQRYWLTPRFAPTCSGEMMGGLGTLVARHQAGVQTHLAENLDEIAWVSELHPEARSYTDVYDRFGLLGPRTVLGHCIHLDDEDLELIKGRGSWVAHCPTSNIALGSGRMPIERYQKLGLSIALATDVGAGPNLSMLDVMRSCIEVHRGNCDLRPGDVLRMASLAGAQAMGEGKRRGALVECRALDAVALRIPGGPPAARRIEHRAAGGDINPYLSFATILGGMITLIGTPPNIVVAQFRDRALGEPFSMFDFSPVGLICAVVGIGFVTLVGWRLIPKGEARTMAGEGAGSVFVAEAGVKADSKSIGQTPADLYPLADSHDVTILGLVRRGKRLGGFAAGEEIRKSDHLVLEGDPASIEAFIGAAELNPPGADAHPAVAKAIASPRR